MSAIISAASIRPSPNCYHGSATYKKAIDLPTHHRLLTMISLRLSTKKSYLATSFLQDVLFGTIAKARLLCFSMKNSVSPKNVII
jgi:hypothetical protein